jgi:hypothetical protein
MAAGTIALNDLTFTGTRITATGTDPLAFSAGANQLVLAATGSSITFSPGLSVSGALQPLAGSTTAATALQTGTLTAALLSLSGELGAAALTLSDGAAVGSATVTAAVQTPYELLLSLSVCLSLRYR